VVARIDEAGLGACQGHAGIGDSVDGVDGHPGGAQRHLTNQAPALAAVLADQGAKGGTYPQAIGIVGVDDDGRCGGRSAVGKGYRRKQGDENRQSAPKLHGRNIPWPPLTLASRTAKKRENSGYVRNDRIDGEMGTRLYVGNLPYSTDDKQLRAVFEEIGQQPREVRIITDRMTGQSR